MARNRRARQALKGQNRDTPWIAATIAMLVMMIAVVTVRWWQDRKPPEIRLGVRYVELSKDGGQYVLNLENAPELSSDGGAVAFRQSAVEAIVIRLHAGDFRVFKTTSRKGRPIKYDPSRGYLVDRRDPSIYYDSSSGLSLVQDDTDSVRAFINSARGSRLEITM